MRLSFRKKSGPRWVDSAGFDWVPESPLYAGPQPRNDVIWKEDVSWDVEDWAGPHAEAPSPARPAPPPAVEEENAPALLLPRLAIGVVQAVALYLLWQARASGIWPGSEPALFSACWLGGLIAPLLLLEGLGAIELRRLLLWSGSIGFLLATLGLWLTPIPLPVFLLVTVAIILAQGWFHAASQDGTPLPAAASFWDFAWAIFVRFCACALIWAVLVLPTLGKDWPRWGEMAPPLLPLLGPIAAGLFAASAASVRQRVVWQGLQICFWVGLPLLLLGTLPLAGLYLLRWFFLRGY